ncbi:MAG: zinc ribbon domain-containing protein [Thaumarchaeota archaeon]|nr:zinc ribbon domain-containing protein [Nitrososphaerota archaeon]
MICPACGAQLPDDALFCSKCGSRVSQMTSGGQQADAGYPASQPAASGSVPSTQQILAPSGVTSLKCPNCGAPIAPKFGEMVITCEYCGSGITLGTQGWTGIQKQSMLDLKIVDVAAVNAIIRPLMDKGLLHRHLEENSTQEEMSLSYVPYWIVSVSARTTVIATNEAAQIGQTATTAALMGVILGGIGGGFGGGGGGGGFGGGGRRRALGLGGLGTLGLRSPGFALSRISAFGMGGMGYGGGAMRKTEQMDANYNFPVVALKALTEYQPRDYQFDLDGRTLFDIAKLPKNIKILNGDISEDVAKSQAKTLVDQLQSEKAHAKYHMIQQITTQSDLGDVELLHAPIWFARFDHKGDKIVLVIDANSGRVINSLGL